jgi:hypothetical protein
MVAGPTSTVLHPLRTITGAVTGGGSDNATAPDETTTTAAESPDAGTREDNTSGDDTTGTTRRSGGATTPTTVANGSSSTPTSAAPISGNTPPPTSPLGSCKAGELQWTTATNNSSYRSGATVEISLHVRNASDRPCYAPANCGTGLSAVINDSAGNQVWRGSTKATSCNAAGAESAPLLNPHDSYSYGTAGSWDQQVCTSGTCSRAAVGTYRATATRGSLTASGATFALR